MPSFKYYENDFELAVLELLNNQGYDYVCGYDIHRQTSEIIIEEDFKKYINNNYSDLSEEEYSRIKNNIAVLSSGNLYRSFKETYSRIISGLDIVRPGKETIHIDYIDFKNRDNNIFKVVNQYEVEEYHNRRPDIIIFINGIPVSVFELKNPADETVNIFDAYDQTMNTYARDISSLMRFDFINVIADGANNKYGSLFSDYEFYFKWNSNDGNDYSNSDGIESVKRLINGLFNIDTLLNVLHHYIFIPDNSDDDLVVVPKYYQYYGSESMFSNILNVYRDKGNKGGTYWGATGCGKSYIMLFLSKRITTSPQLEKPTIILLTDRNDLDEQLSEDFEVAKNYLVDQNSLSIKNRKILKEKLENIESGGIYLMTIQKFSEDLNLLSNRHNIICISDEAHRTQTSTEGYYKRTKDGVKKAHPFGECVRNSFPNAIYVGFTGTPVDSTLKTFGSVVSKYTMKQSKDDGSTVGISRLPGPREVQLDEKLAEACDKYYEALANAGTNEYQIEASKREMTKIKHVLGAPSRLDIVVKHFIEHYEYRCSENSTVNQKAMFICYDREIAFDVYNRIKKLRPDWFVKRKISPEYEGEERDRDALEIEKVKIIATVDSKKDSQEWKDILGTKDDRKKYAKEFKDKKSNFKIAILVDMWITGFDVPSLDTMYLDKPVETHNLIQTISRVNRVFKGKEEGLVVDYIGLEGALLRAMKMYNGDAIPVPNVEVSYVIFKDFLSKIDELMNECDFSSFFDNTITPLERLNIIQKGTEYVMVLKERETNFMGYSLRMKKAFDICAGDDRIQESDVNRMHYYLCVRSVIYKMTIGDTPDDTLMNKKISELVDRAILSTYEGEKFDFSNKDNVTDLFSDEFLNKLKDIPFANTKFQALLKLLKKAIKEFGKTNKLKSTVFSEKLKKVIDKYNARDEIEGVIDIIDDFVDGLSEELEKLFKDLQEEKQSFEKLGITYDEKAFYDILIEVAEKYKFKDQIEDEKFIYLAKEVKKLVSNKSKYTDWTNRQDIKDELYVDVAVLLKKNGYPPKKPIDDAYDEIMKQVENFKKYDD